jgi:hypothetical protein
MDIAQISRRLAAGWLWILAGAMVGGCLGLVASTLRPPLYEASAVVGIGIDRNRADVPDDITVRQAFDRVRGLLLADDTLAEAISLGVGRGGPTATIESARSFRERIRLSERPDGWVLAVLGTDPDETERMARAWAEVAVRRLQTASYHAVRAAEWQGMLMGELSADCADSPSDQLDGLPIGAAGEIRFPAGLDPVRSRSSRGILPALTYSLLRGSSGTASPVIWGRGSLVLGGAIVGLVIGVLFAGSRKRPLPN